MQFVSTRGEAPVLGFSDAVLSGLATDGGLYVPANAGPQNLRPTRSRRLPAGPTPRSPSPSFSRFTTYVGEIADDKLYAPSSTPPTPTFRHPSVTPLVETRSGPFPYPRAVPRADAGVQGRRDAGPGAPDGPHPRRARRPRHHRRRHLRRYRLRCHRGLSRPRHDRHLHPASPRPHLRRAAPPDDDGRRRQRP